MDDEGLAKGDIEPLLALDIVNLVDPCEHKAAQRHLLCEVKRRGIAKLIKSCSHSAVVANLNEAAALANVSDVPHAEVSLVESHIGAVLQDLVSLVAC